MTEGAPETTPGTGTGTGTGPPQRWQPLPPKLLESGAARIAWIGLASAILIILVEVAQYLLQPELAAVFEDPVNRLITLAVVFAGVGLFVLHRYKLATASTMFALGAGYQILVALCVSMIETSNGFDPRAPVLGISALGPWIFVVGAFFPNRPIWTLLTSLAQASVWIAAYAINAWRFDHEPVPLNHLAVWPTINYFLAILAWLVGRKLYGTAIDAERAVELGSYRLMSPIGEGGMGEVWEAKHQMLARKAAIKLVRPEGMSARQAEIAAKRFRREANVIANLQSPHTVYLYDFGASRDGRFYYVMELLDGISLQTLVTKFGPQPATRVAHVMRQICLSLQEAHYYGVIHRDLKPSNIMLCKIGLVHDFVKVLDFGLAKSVTKSEDITQLTNEGVASGTPGYIAPEIALGESAVDHRADLYAVGCVAYFLLTGTLVFSDTNPVTMALKHVQQVPDPPSTRTELPIPEKLEALIMRCLAKTPEERPTSAHEIAEELDGCGLDKWTDAQAATWWETHLPPSSSLRTVDPAQTPHVLQRL
jgi:tRNA A-37 threonylcarbamoyl transferase component Bud32